MVVENLNPTEQQIDGAEPLTDEQRDAIQKDKETPWDEPVKEEKDDIPGEPEEPEVKPEEPEAEEKPEEKDDEAKAAEEAEKAESERLEKKAKELDKTVDEVKEIETAEKTELERLESVAKEEGLTVEQVKEIEAKDKTVADRHGNDPVKIARALRKEQSEYGKLKNEAEGLRKFKQEIDANRAKFNEQQFESQMEANREKVVEQFIEKFPDEAEGLSEDVIFERGKNRLRTALEQRDAERVKELTSKAKDRREELVTSLPDDLKEYSEEVNDLLKQCPDEAVIKDDFNVEFVANSVRGKKFTPEYVKSLEDAAYKRGMEQPKIMDGKNPIKGGRPNEGKVSSKGHTLSDTEKSRAEEVYGRREGWTKARMWDEYAKNDKDKDF